METINDRVEQLINSQFNGNKVAFAQRIGIPATSMSNYFGKERRSKISVKMLERIVTELNVDARWLLIGDTAPAGEVTTHGDYSAGAISGNATVNVGDAVLMERIKWKETLLNEKDERIKWMETLLNEKDERIRDLQSRLPSSER